MSFIRSLAVLTLLALTACGASVDEGLDQPPVALGDFNLGHNIIVGETAQMVPPSREASAEEWERILGEEVDKRFRRYDGEGLYHFGISVDAYALAIPGVPVVVKPKSVLAISVTVWDNSTGDVINEEAKQLTVFENLGVSEEGLVGSGLTQTREEQMRNLSYSASLAIQRWLVANKEWFDKR